MMQIKNAKCQSWTMKIRTGCASLDNGMGNYRKGLQLLAG